MRSFGSILALWGLIPLGFTCEQFSRVLHWELLHASKSMSLQHFNKSCIHRGEVTCPIKLTVAVNLLLLLEYRCFKSDLWLYSLVPSVSQVFPTLSLNPHKQYGSPFSTYITPRTVLLKNITLFYVGYSYCTFAYLKQFGCGPTWTISHLWLISK